MMTKFSLSRTCLNSFLKSKATRFLSKMLRASASTIDGMTIIIFPQFAVSEDLDRFLAEPGAIGEPPDKGVCIRYKVHERSDIDGTV